LLFNAQQRVVVLDPAMISIRNVENPRGLPSNSGQNPRPVLVLNKAGVPGGLTPDLLAVSQRHRRPRAGFWGWDANRPPLLPIRSQAMPLTPWGACLRH
jgi:hypothetical protein